MTAVGLMDRCLVNTISEPRNKGSVGLLIFDALIRCQSPLFLSIFLYE